MVVDGFLCEVPVQAAWEQLVAVLKRRRFYPCLHGFTIGRSDLGTAPAAVSSVARQKRDSSIDRRDGHLQPADDVAAALVSPWRSWTKVLLLRATARSDLG